MSAELATSTFITVQDGLKLHVRCYGARAAAALPVVCLPGLARTAADFENLGVALAADRKAPRWVIALDSRGRGKSDYDRKANYTLQIELVDLMAVLTALGIDKAAFVGTSRGGILIMLLAAARPTVIARCVLNDIGPVIEAKGLMRIRSYVGRLPQPASFHEAPRFCGGCSAPSSRDGAMMPGLRSRAGPSRKRGAGSSPITTRSWPTSCAGSTSSGRFRRCGMHSTHLPVFRCW